MDACYSHWVGGCWALIQAAVGLGNDGRDLWSREGLVRYLLCCAQQPGRKGGLRDKPCTRPDGYHTCYSLAGLSAGMNRYFWGGDERGCECEGGGVEGGKREGGGQAESSSSSSSLPPSGRLESAFHWKATPATTEERQAWGFDEVDAVRAVHPVFVLPMEVVERVREQFAKGGFA